jgi:RNA polymerase sigma-70 factor (ECF subfamily)
VKIEPDGPSPPPTDDVPSVELIRRAREGDRQAVDILFGRYLPTLRRWATGRLPRWARDYVDTDDMIQDTLIRTFRNVQAFVPRHDGAFGAYLRQALRNRIRDEVRRAQRSPRPVEMRDDHEGRDASPLEQAIGREALERYEEALLRLTEEERELVLARIEMGLSYKALAEAMGKPTADAARMAVGRALVRLAMEMDHGV